MAITTKRKEKGCLKHYGKKSNDSKKWNKKTVRVFH
jgi:hypothetical protein